MNGYQTMKKMTSKHAFQMTALTGVEKERASVGSIEESTETLSETRKS